MKKTKNPGRISAFFVRFCLLLSFSSCGKIEVPTLDLNKGLGGFSFSSTQLADQTAAGVSVSYDGTNKSFGNYTLQIGDNVGLLVAGLYDGAVFRAYGRAYHPYRTRGNGFASLGNEFQVLDLGVASTTHIHAGVVPPNQMVTLLSDGTSYVSGGTAFSQYLLNGSFSASQTNASVVPSVPTGNEPENGQASSLAFDPDTGALDTAYIDTRGLLKLTSFSQNNWNVGGEQTLSLGASQVDLKIDGTGSVAVWRSKQATTPIVTAGSKHSCVLNPEGDLKCVGNNASGQLGNSSTTSTSTPVTPTGFSVSSARTVTDVSAGGDHTCLVYTSAADNTGTLSTGAVMCFGNHSDGQLGNGVAAGTNSSAPVAVTGLDGSAAASGASSLALGFAHSCALTVSGIVKCWGDGAYGQLGNGAAVDSTTPVNVTMPGGAPTATAISSGAYHSCMIGSDSNVYCWGRGAEGQLGDAALTDNLVPSLVTLPGAATATLLAAGGYHTCALASDSNVYCWGFNISGELGTGDLASTSAPLTPVSGLGGITVSKIDAGGSYLGGHTCIVPSSGAPKCWGSNIFGELGDRKTQSSAVPKTVQGFSSTSVTQISAGDTHTCLVSSKGVQCFGHNIYGQLGLSETLSSLTSDPHTVVGLTGTQISSVSVGGAHGCLQSSGSEAFCFGNNDSGQIGNNENIPGPSATRPTRVTGLSDVGVSSIATGERHSCAVTDSGGVRCWGENTFGQLGDGTTVSHSTATSVSGIEGVKLIKIGSGNHFACGLTDGGNVKCWGDGTSGKLGNNAALDSDTPVNVVTDTAGTLLDDISDIAVGYDHACALNSSGKVYCWGKGSAGQIGNSLSADVSIATSVTNIDGISLLAISIAAGANHTCAILSNSGARCWGEGSAGQLGQMAGADSSVPLTVKDSTGAELKSVGQASLGDDFSCFIVTSTSVTKGVQCVGEGSSGQLGNAASADSTTIRTVVTTSGTGTLSSVVQIASGNAHTCALIADGTLQCWGLGTTGQLGDGLSTTSNIPVQVPSGTLSGVLDVTAGTAFTCALTSSGSVKCFGEGSSGQIGDAASTDRVSPTSATFASYEIGGVSPTLVGLDAGVDSVCALASDGTSVCWGSNSDGQLGDNNVGTSQSAPKYGVILGRAVSVAAGSAHTCVKMDNEGLKCFGNNDFGQLGDGTTTDRSTPVDVTNLDGEIASSRKVLSVVTGKYHTCAYVSGGAIEPVQCFGLNNFGQLGDGTTTNRLIPTDVGAGTLVGVVSELAAGGYHTCAYDTGGTRLRCFGANHFGQVGVGTTTAYYTSPQTVATASTLTSLTAGMFHTCYIQDSAANKVQCFGNNEFGQLGDGGTIPGTNQTSPTTATTDLDTLSATASSITAGIFTTCVLDDQGAVSCWGYNQFGQLGDGTKSPSIVQPINTVMQEVMPCVSLYSSSGGCLLSASTLDSDYGVTRFISPKEDAVRSFSMASDTDGNVMVVYLAQASQWQTCQATNCNNRVYALYRNISGIWSGPTLLDQDLSAAYSATYQDSSDVNVGGIDYYTPQVVYLGSGRFLTVFAATNTSTDISGIYAKTYDPSSGWQNSVQTIVESTLLGAEQYRLANDLYLFSNQKSQAILYAQMLLTDDAAIGNRRMGFKTYQFNYGQSWKLEQTLSALQCSTFTAADACHHFRVKGGMFSTGEGVFVLPGVESGSTTLYRLYQQSYR